MSPSMFLWLKIWCWNVILFGAVLAAAAFEATSGPTRWLYALIGGGVTLTLDDAFRFSLGVMGAVTIGWGTTLYGMVRLAEDLGLQGQSVWRWMLVGMLTWFVVDGTLSTLTGFAGNLVPNTLFLIGLLYPLLSSGVLKRA